MSLGSFVVLLVVAAAIGGIGQMIAGYTRLGCLGSIVVGFVGGMLGVWMQRMTGVHDLFTLTIGGQSFPIAWAIAGSALFVGILGLLQRGGRRLRHA